MSSLSTALANEKQIVADGYDRCVAAYEAARRPDSEPALELLVERLSQGARMLDIGCGTGVPVARQLSRDFDVMGVDLSVEMVRRARIRVPSATFIQSDIMSADIPASHCDAVVALYCIFHLPRDEHRELFARVHRWLKPGGYLLATLSAHDEAPYTEDGFFGVTMYWSNYGLRDYADLLRDTGFEILESTELGHGYRKDHPAASEQHPLILAQKIRD